MTWKERFEIIGNSIEIKNCKEGDIILFNTICGDEECSYVGIFSHTKGEEIWCNFSIPSFDDTFTEKDIPAHEEFFKDQMQHLLKSELVDAILLRRK